MKRRFFTFVSLLFIAVASAFAQAPSERFYVEVSGYDGPNKTTVKAVGYNDWSFKIMLPSKNSYVGAGQVDIFARLTDVDALGITGSKEYSKTLTSDIQGSLLLNEYFDYLYNHYKKTTFPITVIDEDGEDNAVLYVTKSGDVISGVLDSKANGDACSERFMKHGKKLSDDGTYGLLKSGAWIKFGNEQLDVVSNIQLGEGNSVSGALDNVKAATNLVEREFETNDADEQGAESFTLQAFIPKGSSVTFKGHKAMLLDDCYVTIDASEAYDGDPLENWISELRNASGKEEKVKMLFKKINNIFAIMDECTVPVEIRFGESTVENDQVLTVYYSDPQTGEQTLVEQTIDEFNETLESHPNAVAVVTYEYAYLKDSATKNLIVEYPVGHGKYYECENFVLTDKVDFYTPVDFVAVDGTYTRTPNTVSVPGAFYNSVCLPFEFSGSDLSSTAQILTFSFYEEKDGDRNIYFNKKSTIPAANPCVVYDEADTWNIIDFDNTPIYATPDNSGNMQGTFVLTDEYAGTHYSVNVQNKFAKLADTLAPFRSCLSLDPGVIIPESEDAKMNIIIIDETAGIESVKAEANYSDAIYNLQGMRVTNIVKGGIYVKNGKKIIIK